MQTKLTLRLDSALIEAAKAHAERSGKSLSSLVADFFALLGQPVPEDEALPPRTAALRGILRGADVDEEDYRRYLERKHR